MASAKDIADLIDLQASMIDALDRQDLPAIEQTTQALAAALGRMNGGVVRADAALLDALNHSLRQNDATRARLHFLALRNRQKLDTLAALRGVGTKASYNKHNITII
jgi:hypothetical protein